MANQSDDDRKHALAARLTELGSGQLKIEFYPTTFTDEDMNDDVRNGAEPPSKGHQFHIERLDTDSDGDPESTTMWCDDRKGPLPALIAAELRRVAELYDRAARQLEEAAETGQPIPPAPGQESLVIVRVPAEWQPEGDATARWEDIPEDFEPVAMVEPNITFRGCRDHEPRDFNRLSFYHCEPDDASLWMMPMDSAEALPLNLPSWNSIKAEQPIDYDEGDIIGWHCNVKDEWLGCAIEAARSLDPAILIGGVPIPLYKECEVRLEHAYDFNSMIFGDLPLSAIDFETGELVVTSKVRRKRSADEQAKPEKRYKLDGEHGPETLAVLRELVAAGEKRKTLFPKITSYPQWNAAREAFDAKALALLDERCPKDEAEEEEAAGD